MIKRDLWSKFGVYFVTFQRDMIEKGLNFYFLGLFSALEVAIDLGGQIFLTKNLDMAISDMYAKFGSIISTGS